MGLGRGWGGFGGEILGGVGGVGGHNNVRVCVCAFVSRLLCCFFITVVSTSFFHVYHIYLYVIYIYTYDIYIYDIYIYDIYIYMIFMISTWYT